MGAFRKTPVTTPDAHSESKGPSSIEMNTFGWEGPKSASQDYLFMAEINSEHTARYARTRFTRSDHKYANLAEVQPE